jgi:hypothetical protein
MAKKKKILKSKYKGDWNGFPIKVLPVDDIWQSVVPVDELPTLRGKPFKKNLIEDIRRDGMHFPIMVVHTTHEELLKAKEKWGEKLSPLPFWHNDKNPQSKKIWSVWGGSQRLDVAKILGFTHIDCTIIPSIGRAISLQKHMRKPFAKRYYE